MRPAESRMPLRELRSHPAVRNYMLFCLGALFLLVVCLTDRGLDWWCLAPASIGCLTLLAQWRHGPPLVLLSLAGLLGMPGPRYVRGYPSGSLFQTPSFMDLVLCFVVLAYVLGHYRLLSLMRSIFPAESRRRSADLVTPWEMASLGVVLPIWSGLAVMIWAWLMEGEPPLDMSPLVWRVVRIVWTVLGLLATTGIVVHYVRLTTATPEESILYLQDELWRQTRREQSRLHHWLTWARLRAQRKKERL